MKNIHRRRSVVLHEVFLRAARAVVAFANIGSTDADAFEADVATKLRNEILELIRKPDYNNGHRVMALCSIIADLGDTLLDDEPVHHLP